MVPHFRLGPRGEEPQQPRKAMAAMKAAVIATLAVLAWIAGQAPFMVRPAGLSPSIGLGTFQVMVAAVVGLAALVLLLAASYSAIFWAEFLRPRNYGGGVLQSLKYAGIALCGEFVLFMGMVAASLPSFYSDTGTGPGTFTFAVENWLHGLTAAVAVAGGIMAARALILAALSAFAAPGR